ncbi:sensor histidine kinase [Loktanella agnita]|uniref:sensor histidine kinase n=1 Tax=Loktanella agnita TaxID=287097 RepID=UPI003985D809
MALARKPENDDTRMAILQGYDVLDSEAESEFDDIVALASEICNAPISIISLIDHDRQWFKAKTGLADGETPLEESICAHGILEEGIFEIHDTHEDPRTADNPLVMRDPNFRFYAGAQLIAAGDQPIGMLCVIDSKPRMLTDFQRKALRVLSQQVVTQLELRKRLRAEHTLRAEMDHRVKNSLQTLSSMVRMAGSSVKDEKALDALKLINRHIESVSALHRELMVQQGRDLVSVGPYLKRVCELLQDAAPGNVLLDTEVTNVDISARLASALGMVVCEFVANALKHGFPDDDFAGRIMTRLDQDGDMLTLTCTDNGVGVLASRKNGADDTGMGKMLMDAATEQLRGTMTQDSSPAGTTLRVTFPAAAAYSV